MKNSVTYKKRKRNTDTRKLQAFSLNKILKNMKITKELLFRSY